MWFDYDMPLYRPPSEAESLILQVTLGCAHNRCTFCSMYRNKRFTTRRIEELVGEIDAARASLGAAGVRRVFLADGDAMCLSTRRLEAILTPLNAAFPALQRVGIYANARDILRKSDQELTLLRRLKLRMLYVGLESGDDDTLAAVDKGATVDQVVEATQRAMAAGMSISTMVLIGLAGRQRSQRHARASAAAINRMIPTYTALLTYSPTPGSPLFETIQRGDLELPSPPESLREIRTFLAELDCKTYFHCNHASNYLPLRGKLPGAKEELLALLDAALGGQIPLKPEHLRGL